MFKVSPLRLRVFRTCLLRYKYQYVERLRARLRIQDTAGSCVHSVLGEFFAKVAAPERTAERLLSMFDRRWGALSPRYLSMDGVEALGRGSRQQLEKFARQQELTKQPFLVEAYFETHLAPDIVLFGRLDRADEEADFSLHIVDYKTGSHPEEVEGDQLRLYAVLAQDNLERRVSRGSFWYLDDSQMWTIELDEDEKAQAKEDAVLHTLEMRRATEFPGTIAPHCAFCPYLHACELRNEIAEQRQVEGW